MPALIELMVEHVPLHFTMCNALCVNHFTQVSRTYTAELLRAESLILSKKSVFIAEYDHKLYICRLWFVLTSLLLIKYVFTQL